MSLANKTTTLLRTGFIFMGVLQLSHAISQTTLLPVYNDCPISRRYAYVWFFGDNAGLDFNHTDQFQPEVISGESNVQQLEGGACICNKFGDLQIYTTGENISLKNLTYNYIENGIGLTGYYSSTQSSIIIPQPGNENTYYVFQVNIPYFQKGLTYSVLDMDANNGLGKVTEKNVLLLDKVSEKITAVNSTAGEGVWITTHKWGSDEFYSYLLTEEGITDTVVSKTGTVHFEDSEYSNAIGYMKFSPDGTKLALAIYGMGILEIFDFDTDSGIVSAPITSQPNFQGVYGIGFSPSGSLLYATTIDLNGSANFQSRLLQFDINDGDAIFDNPINISVSDSATYFCGIQLGPDARIYIAKSPLQNNRLDVVFNPGRKGHDCNYNYLNGETFPGIDLLGGKSKFGLPNFNQSYFNFKKFVNDKCCQYDEIQFRLTNMANVDSAFWKISKNGHIFYETGDSIFNIRFTESGVYEFEVNDFFEGKQYSKVYDFNVLVAPEPNIGEDTTFVELFKSITLDAGYGFETYLWNTGSTNQSIIAGDSGLYLVEVSDIDCCKNTDTTIVEYVNVFVPNAFTPNNDGANDKVYVRGTFFKEIDFSIFNRLGEIVFHTNNQTLGWDGTFKGENQDMGVYYYFLTGTLETDVRIERKGNITLIR